MYGILGQALGPSPTPKKLQDQNKKNNKYILLALGGCYLLVDLIKGSILRIVRRRLFTVNSW